jgi:UDP-N-acetylmuramoyl-tripeptide--D-alanyl-D-alanine ligase
MENELAIARAHRRGLSGVVFVGITGSCGKTTTKDLAAGLLAPQFHGSSNPGSGNCGAELIEHLLQVQPTHAFCIQELGAWGPGTLEVGLELLRPDLAVVLNIRRDHFSAFRGLEHTQAEKGKLVERLPPEGTAILNADDPHVWEMRHRTCSRVLGFGSQDHADFRFANVCSVWPERLSFSLTFSHEHYRVHTQLIGEHLVGSAVAAIAIAHTLGVKVSEAVERIAELQPTPRRMSSAVTESGVAVVRDDFKAASDSLDEFLHFLREARADRKVAVIGQIADYPGRSRPIYTSFAKSAAEITDLLLFVGERAENLWGGVHRKSPNFLSEFNGARARIHVFETVRDASRFLRSELRFGDLLALKGSGTSDHLERIFLEHQTSVRCWRAHCGLVLACDDCNLLGLIAEFNDALPGKYRATCGQPPI